MMVGNVGDTELGRGETCKALRLNNSNWTEAQIKEIKNNKGGEFGGYMCFAELIQGGYERK
jgi:hypothetical protein